MEKIKFETIDEYIATFPEEVQKTLQELRQRIQNIVPEAKEKISYQMPTFTLDGNLVHFAAFKNHIGLYPGASGVAAFQSELQQYKTSKGAIQFPIDQPLPFELIKRIVLYKVEEHKLKPTKKKTRE